MHVKPRRAWFLPAAASGNTQCAKKAEKGLHVTGSCIMPGEINCNPMSGTDLGMMSA